MSSKTADPKKEGPKKDLVAELDVAALFKSRCEAAEKQKEAAEKLDSARQDHVLFCALAGLAAMVVAVYLWLGVLLPDDDSARDILLFGAVLLGLALWIGAAFPGATVLRRQNEATAAARQLKSIDDKIAFCHLVQDEAKRVKVRRYAEALVQKEIS
jgi:hypothetical protein